MPVFEYTAMDSQGNRFSGVCDDIAGVAMLREDLGRMGDTLLKAKRRKAQTTKRARITQQEIATFAYKFAGMSSAGLSIVRCLETLEQQTQNRAFRNVIADLRRSIATGTTLKSAFEKHRSIFPEIFIGMLEAGETGGRLSQTLEASAEYLDKRADFRHKVRSAFAYPVIVGGLSFAVVACLVAFIVPIFSKLYQQMHIPLPGPTQFLIDLSVLIRDRWWAIPLVIGVALYAAGVISKSQRLRAGWDAFKLKMPVFSELNRMIVSSRFVRTLAMLISTGVSLPRSLDVAGRVADNARVCEIAERLQESIRAGNPVADSLAGYDIFPPVVVQLAACGEESGTLPEMLNKAAELLEKDIDRTIKSLLVKIEPAMTVIIGVVVGFILISVYMPMFDYMSHLK